MSLTCQSASQILSDPKSRKNYDYALAHPEETLYNEYQYYYSQYEKYWRTDARMVVAGFLAVVSLIQYASKQATYQQARSRTSVSRRIALLLRRVSQIALSHAQGLDPCHGLSA